MLIAYDRNYFLFRTNPVLIAFVYFSMARLVYGPCSLINMDGVKPSINKWRLTNVACFSILNLVGVLSFLYCGRINLSHAERILLGLMHEKQLTPYQEYAFYFIII